MPVTNPTSVPLPADVVAATEAARNNVTLLQAEARRLQGLAESCEREVSGLAARKADLEAEIPLLIERNRHAEEGAASAELRRATALAEAEDAALRADAARQEAEVAREAASARELELAAREAAIDDRDAKLAQDERALTVKQDALDARVRRIAEAVS